jgi:spore germination protein
MKKIVLIFVLIICLLFNGCLDRVEIDKKIFISTIGIGMGKEIDKKQMNIKASDPFPETDLKKLNVTYAFPDVSEAAGKNGTFNEKTINVDAYSMEDSNNKATVKSSRIISFGHTKLLMLGSEFLKHQDTVKEVVDYLQRQPSLNRMMLVVITDGNVQDFVKFKPEMEKNIQTYITGLMENSRVSSTVPPVTLNEFIQMLNENGNASLPIVKIDKEKNEIILSGLGIIKNYAYIGDLSLKETSNLEILSGKIKSGTHPIFIEGHPVDFTIENVKRKVKMKSSDDKLEFDIELKVEGQIKGYFAEKKVFTKEFLSNIEENLNTSMEIESETIAKKVQNEYSVDTLDLRENVRKYHPKTWDKVKDNWEDAYKKSDIKVTVNSKVRRIGVIE